MMAKRRMVLLGIVAMVPMVLSVEARSQDHRMITVDGNAEIRVVPNEVVLTVGIETFDHELAIAKADNDERVTALLKITESLGIDRKDVRTDYLNIQPQFQDHQDRGNFLRYLVRKTVVITLHDINKFEVLLSSLLEAGVNYVHGVTFRTTEMSTYCDEAQASALSIARQKADAMAERLGQRIGRPLSIRLSDRGWRSSYGSWGRSGGDYITNNVIVDVDTNGAQLEGPTTPGQIIVTARVTVSYELVE
jgi:uncharacterized protein YggE